MLALVAHDEKKDDLLALARLHLLATAHAGSLLAEELDLPVERFRSGPEGGDIQIGARIVQGDVDAVVFLRVPLTARPDEPDIQALLKVCDVHGVPVATNLASAEILLLDYAVIANPASEDAYRTDLATAAVQELVDEGVDVNGAGYQKETVEVTPGGE